MTKLGGQEEMLLWEYSFGQGVVVNQMNAGDAREAANERLKILSDLKSKKRCG
jgi:hypothetical protein